MATREEMFPSRFLKAVDLGGKAKIFHIIAAEKEELTDLKGKKQEKMVLHFKGTNKVLPLNVTNWNLLVDITGEADSEDWIDFKIALAPGRTSLGGKTVDCIRIESVDAVKAKKKPTPESEDPGAGLLNDAVDDIRRNPPRLVFGQ
jgi:hypothetical protein